jgi:hypothetical protein
LRNFQSIKLPDPKKIKEIMDEAHFSHLGRDYMRKTIKYLFNVEIPHLEKEIMNYFSKCKICLQESTGKTPIFYNVTNQSDLSKLKMERRFRWIQIHLP